MADNVTRRRFMQTTATALLVTAARGAARAAGANDRINLAVIGTGGQGTYHVRSLHERRQRDAVEVIRVCDVYRRRLEQAAGIAEITGGAAATMEYRRVLDDPDVDAVVIATPDHWHTKIAIEAMEAGKDVYVEKPLSLSIAQALECRDAVRRTGRVLQVGPQGASDDRYWTARRVIGDGRIGPVTWSSASFCRNSHEGQFNWRIDPDARPDTDVGAPGYVWWDRWLGHEWGLAERVPWDPDRFFRFRKYFAYNGGVATDLLYHKLAPLLLAVTGPDGEYPRRVVASGGLYLERDGRDIPDTFMMMVDYPSDHTVALVSVMTNDVGVTEAIHGRHGTMTFGDGSIRLAEQAAWWREFRRTNAGRFANGTVTDDEGREQPDPAPGGAAFDVYSSPRRDHMGNFLDAVREGAAPNCNVELGCATMVAIKMGVEAYRTGRTLYWDAQREEAGPLMRPGTAPVTRPAVE